MTSRINQYTYQVTWSEEDGAYAGHCLEFPYVSWLDESRDGALVGIQTTVFDCIRYKEASGESVPAPYASRESMRT